MSWWMIVATASFIATFLFFWYLVFYGPLDPNGIKASFANNMMVIRSLDFDSPFKNGGLEVGDRVLTIDDQPMRIPRDWTASTGNMRIAQPQVWLVSRQERNLRLEIVYPPAQFRTRLIEGYIHTCHLNSCSEKVRT